MTYELPLDTVSLGTGAVLALASLPGIFQPEAVRNFITSLPRNFVAGVAFMLISLAWVVWLLNSVLDLGEFTPQRGSMIIFVIALAAAAVFFLPDYLFSRAWGIFLLLATELLLSAAFPHETRWKWVIVIIAYGWATSGIIFVAAPYTLRNLLERWNKNNNSTRISSTINLALGILLMVLSFTAYGSL